MRVVRVAAVLASLALASAPPLRAQAADEILLVEREADRAGRDRLWRRLRALHMDLVGDALTAADLLASLRIATAGKVDLAIRAKAERAPEWPALALELRRVPVTTVLAAITRASDARFVWFAGVVLLAPQHEVRGLHTLRVYDLRAATAPLRDHPGPELGLGQGGLVVPEPQDTGKTISGFTLDGILDLVRTHVDPESWDGGATIHPQRGSLLIRQSERNHRRIAELLETLGVWSRPRIISAARSAAPVTATRRAG